MLLILLNDFASISVILNDLLVGTTSQENVLSIIRRVIFNTEGSLSVCEASDYLASLCVPKLNNLVKASTQESSTIIAEAYVSHSLRMTHVGPQTPLVS
jgi:hypothetical protein